MITENKRGKVWLAVSGLVIDNEGKWLVVKKRYGGLKGQWSLPAGFVNAGETADEAVIREVKEETGIDCSIQGLLGLRTGVIREEISDNMLVFLLSPKSDQNIIHQESELYEASYLPPEEILKNPDASILLRYLIDLRNTSIKPCINGVNPGDQFGYTAYKMFL